MNNAADQAPSNRLLTDVNISVSNKVRIGGRPGFTLGLAALAAAGRACVALVPGCVVRAIAANHAKRHIQTNLPLPPPLLSLLSVVLVLGAHGEILNFAGILKPA